MNSSCVTRKDHHIPPFEEIEPGIILINGYSGPIFIDDTQRILSGTFIIKFHNSTLKTSNRTFKNIEASPLQTIPAIVQPTPFEINHINLLSLEALSELQINNSKTPRDWRVVNVRNTTYV